MICREALRVLVSELRVIDCCPTCGRSRLESIDTQAYLLIPGSSGCKLIIESVASFPLGNISIDDLSEKHLRPAMKRMAFAIKEFSPKYFHELEIPQKSHQVDRATAGYIGM